MPFPNQLQTFLAPGVVGDFASANPRASVDAGEGKFIASAAGVIVGRFAWADYVNTLVSNTGTGAPTGFVHREQQGLITTFLAESGLLIPGGLPVVLHQAGDFWVVNDGPNVTTVGMKAYAKYADGKVIFAPAGTPQVAGSGSASSIAAGAGSVTGSISGNVLTVTAYTSGSLNPGGTITGTGIQTGTTIVSQLTGTPGQIGTYAVNIPQTVASTAITESHGVLTIGGTVVAGLGVGDVLSGSGVAAGTFITALGTGSGGAGTYIVNNNTVVGSTAISGTSAYETKWFSADAGRAPGEIVRMSSWALG